jgi:hypothetical protein
MWQSLADAKARMLSRCGGTRVILEGIGHSDFCDEIFLSPLRRYSRVGSIPRKRVALILNAYTVAFFQQTLCNVEEPILAQGAQPFPEAAVKIWQRSIVEESVSRTVVC